MAYTFSLNDLANWQRMYPDLARQSPASVVPGGAYGAPSGGGEYSTPGYMVPTPGTPGTPVPPIPAPGGTGAYPPHFIGPAITPDQGGMTGPTPPHFIGPAITPRPGIGQYVSQYARQMQGKSPQQIAQWVQMLLAQRR